MTNFIEQYKIDKKLCDEIIEYRKDRPNVLGATGSHVDKDIKDSLDSRFCESDSIYINYISELDKCLIKYIKKYSTLKNINFMLSEGMNIQFYPPGGGYKIFHCELDRNTHPYNKRFLVFMTYLNDVYIGGQTEFLYQKKSFRARKGKTLIWPVDWTHTHRGIVAPFQEKVIVTGWMHLA
jgi:prolyl 4-hydroxylase